MKNSFKLKIIISFLIIIFGILLNIAMPPFSKPDEPVHFERALDVASFNLICQNGKEIKSVDNYFKPIYEISSKYKIAGGSPTLIPYKEYLQPIFKKITENDYQTKALHFCGFNFIPYLLHAFGIKLGLIINFNPFLTYYLGRISNLLLLTSFFLWFLIKKENKIFWLFAIILSMPMTLHQIGGYSYDGFVIIFSFIFLTLLTQPFSYKNLIGLFISLIIIIFSKHLLYLPFIFLFLGYLVKSIKLKTTKINSQMNLIYLSLILFTIIVSIYYGKSIFLKNINEYTRAIEPSLQIQMIFNNPDYLIRVINDTFYANFYHYLKSIVGNLAWYNLSLYTTIYLLYLYIYLYLIGDNNLYLIINKNKYFKNGFLLNIFFLFFQTAIIFFIMLLSWTRIGSTMVEGVQSRYFIPYLPLIIIIINQSIKKLNLSQDKFFFFSIFFAAILTINNLYQTYYNYSKNIVYDPTLFRNISLVKIKNLNKVHYLIKLKQNRKIAAVQFVKENNDPQAPFILSIMDAQCQKILRKIIIPADELNFNKDKLFFFKPLKIEDKNYCLEFEGLKVNHPPFNLSVFVDEENNKLPLKYFYLH